MENKFDKKEYLLFAIMVAVVYGVLLYRGRTMVPWCIHNYTISHIGRNFPMHAVILRVL